MMPPATEVENAIIEMEVALDELLPIQEGLADYLRLDLQAATAAAVEGEKGAVDLRVSRLRQALFACKELMTDGYPLVPQREVEAAVLADLQQNEATIRAALAKFSPATASSLGLEVGAVEPKVVVPLTPSEVAALEGLPADLRATDVEF